MSKCPCCENEYLSIRTDFYKDSREFVYCDVCGAMADRRIWNMIPTRLNTKLGTVIGHTKRLLDGTWGQTVTEPLIQWEQMSAVGSKLFEQAVILPELPKEIYNKWYKENGYPSGDAFIVQRIWRDCYKMLMGCK